MHFFLEGLERQLSGALFDLDGTLVDSLPAHLEAWAQACEGSGVQMTPQITYETEGAHTLQIAKLLFETQLGHADEAEYSALALRKERAYSAFPSPPFMDGARELLEAMRAKGIPLCVVTGGKNIRSRFANEPWFLELFSGIVSADDTKSAKPLPDPFIIGAQRLGIPAFDCLAVENAPLGLQAAAAAECLTVAVKESSPLSPELLMSSGASRVFLTVKELAAAIRF